MLVLTVVVEVKKLGHILGRAARVTRVRESGVGIPQFIEEWMNHRIYSRQALRRSILKKL